MTLENGLAVFRRVEAVLFDLDGVLVDSTASIERAWRSWAKSSEVTWDRVLPHVHGRRAVETIRRVFPDMSADRIAAEADGVNALQVGDEHIAAVRGALEFIADLPARSWAVVTASPRDLALARLRYAGFVAPNVIVSAGDVKQGKPDPSCYLRAAERMGAEPSRCLVVEDAPSGVRAAKNAAMRCVALSTTHERAELDEADAVAGDLADFQIVPEDHAAFTVRLRSFG